ncbi:hypothetical protein HXX76_011271 [Chlamydomonas incerta]|uniref:Uncharacterized protein n=1 Tax=Chlamydomonas incerta TaxID=51695 RepID=A0A835VXC6_CHLIN|nr:hypothetical protein HXX76_011271 [Chlamydomonas incerta]|eukprot:KAG2429029.1 hypothetical protein HXX76_011271 [Chlamydomonas incerta]
MQRVLEQARQSLHVGERTFKPTPNLRNPAMLAEAEEFATHMTAFKTGLRRYQAAVQVFLEGLPVVARGNLPRVWERVEGGLCEPLRPNVSHSHPTRVGGEFDEGLLRDARDMLDAELRHNVLRPIDRWLESLAVVRTRMRKLEGLRLAVDARRRRVHRRYMRALGRMERRGGGVPFGRGGGVGIGGGGVGGVSSRRSRSAEPGRGRGYGGTREREEGLGAEGEEEEEGLGTSSPGSSDGEYEMSYGPRGSHEDEVRAVRGKEDFMRSALYYQRKLEAVQSTYREQEDLVWQHLSGLVRDAAWLKAFVAGAMLSVKDALQATAIALGPCKLPLPAFPRFNAGGEYGSIGDPSPLIADVPDSLKSAAAATAAASPMAALMAGGAGGSAAGSTAGGALTRLDAREVSAALRPKRITAQPLQTAADHTTPRYGPVPPVVRGSPGVPLDELAQQEAAAAGGGTGGGAAALTGSTTAALPPAGASAHAHGGGVFGALKELASEVTAAAKAKPLPAGTGAGTGTSSSTAVY